MSGFGEPHVERLTYPRYGANFYWIVDPDARILEAFELRDGLWVNVGSYDEMASARIAPFDAIELSMMRLFLPRPKSHEEP